MQRQSQSSPKRQAASPQRQTASPTRDSQFPRFTETMLEQGDTTQLQLLLKEREIELEHKLNTLIALNEKLQVFNDLKKDVSENQACFRTSEDGREQLQITITTTANKLKEDTEMKEKFQQSLQVKISELMEEIQEQERQAAHTQTIHLDQMNSMEARHHTDVTKLNQENADLRTRMEKREQDLLRERQDIETRNRADLQKQASEYEQLDRRYRADLASQQDGYRQQLADLQSRHAAAFEKQEREFAAMLNSLMEKNRRELAEAQQAHARDLKTHQDHSMSQLRDLHDRIVAQEKVHLERLQRQETEAANRERQLQAEISRINTQYKVDLDRLRREMEQMRIEKDVEIRQLTLTLEEQRNSYEIKINELEQTLMKYQQMTVRLESTVLELNTRLAQKEDVEKQLELWKSHHDSMEQSKQELQDQLEGASAYIGQLEEKFYESQQTQLEMLKQMKDYEAEIANSASEIEQLRQYIIDLKSRIAVYIPVKGDLIDKKLAEYINNYPDRQKLKIMFMRENEGVYQFGTKRVWVKCVKDKIEIKVGGGFLSLDEFLDQYTPVELEKLERKDPMRRMTDRIALQKTLKGRATDSPLNSPMRQSPQKASPKKKRAV